MLSVRLMQVGVHDWESCPYYNHAIALCIMPFLSFSLDVNMPQHVIVCLL
ncbi:hypothetical protein WN943_005302 [Citrus x changshan-huyou]